MVMWLTGLFFRSQIKITWKEALQSKDMRVINIAIARNLAPFKPRSKEAREFVLNLFEGEESHG